MRSPDVRASSHGAFHGHSQVGGATGSLVAGPNQGSSPSEGAIAGRLRTRRVTEARADSSDRCWTRVCTPRDLHVAGLGSPAQLGADDLAQRSRIDPRLGVWE
jgi:hypothetical protein